ncbi:MAG: MFS transporter [Clostridia bacterium]|nr:MFS transporter [Clostridia bacterium]
MFTFLIVIIYLAFISLGLPDSLLGAAWPVIRVEFGASLDFAGVISMVICAGTIVSSLLSDRTTRKFGAGTVTAVSVALTALALFGFSVSDSVFEMCLWSIPYGLGAGGVDAALNNYVALHYSARHMSWLHCFWGVGASISPYIMGSALTWGLGWRRGYVTVSAIQIVLALILFVTLPVWKKVSHSSEHSADEENYPPVGLTKALKIPGVPYILIAFLCECAIETTAGLWAASYLVDHKGVDPDTAAFFASAYFLGVTFGRFLLGFITDKIGDRGMIRIGCGGVILGILMMMIPVPSTLPALIGLVVLGLGIAPIYPSIIHATPSSFGRENSQAIVGIQMASAYTGSTFVPPVFGLIAKNISIGLYPFCLAVLAVLMLIMTERLNAMFRKAKKS